jgi:hypothetical protein
MLRILNLNFATTYFLDTCGAFARRPPISKSYNRGITMLRISNLNFAASYFLDTCGAFASRPPISKSYDENEAL